MTRYELFLCCHLQLEKSKFQGKSPVGLAWTTCPSRTRILEVQDTKIASAWVNLPISVVRMQQEEKNVWGHVSNYNTIPFPIPLSPHKTHKNSYTHGAHFQTKGRQSGKIYIRWCLKRVSNEKTGSTGKVRQEKTI